MQKAQKVSWFVFVALAVFLLSIVSNIALGETEIMSPDQYMDKYQQLQRDGASAEERASLLEEGLHYYPAFMVMRYNLLIEYTILHDDEKAKVCAKEALQYEPQSKFYAHMYLITCDLRDSPDEAEAAAKYVLALCESQLPPAGEIVIMNENYDINSYNDLSHCMDAYQTLFQIYYYREDMKTALECSDWILKRKDDSEFGYDKGLYVMSGLALHYGKIKQFDKMERWLDQYFAFEATADEKGDAYMQIRSRVKMFTEAMTTIKEAYLAHGSDIDVQALLNQSLQN